MNILKNSNHTKVLWLIAISTFLRTFLAATLELGNDEVYYRLYALYPDWSHFDHPPMVGLVIQLFSLNMLFQGELALRFGSVIIGALNILLMFRIGARIKDEKTGFYASLLYAASLYGSLISGVFILPDTPQGLFWLLAIYIMVTTLPAGPDQRGAGKKMLLLGLVLGLGMLSKYTTIFLWLGIILYTGLFRREWFRHPAIYAAAVISFISILPVIIWNFQNDFISFTFHSERVDATDTGINFNYFLREVIGEWLYNNPVNVALILTALILITGWKLELKKAYQALLVLSSMPLIITFLIISLFRETLPHWSAPAYVNLLFLAAALLSQLRLRKANGILVASVGFTLVIVIAGYIQIQYGMITFEKAPEYHRLGKNDPSVDMYGYRQAGQVFSKIVARDIANGEMPEQSVLFGDNWFPLANYDYYAARPAGIHAMGIADLDHLHKYAWINQKLGGFYLGMDGYYISDSRYYRIPQSSLSRYFELTEAIDTIQIYRNNEIVKRVFVWRLINMKKLPEDPFRKIK
ncbi:MAG: glycosyltransferase family 39 protein [bacterium]